VEFDDSRDAEDAIEEMDGRDVRGCRLRVEYSRRKGGGKGGGRFGDRGGSRAPERTDYRVRVTGLPSYTNWRDLKDFLREGGEITYADVGQDGVGVAEFASRRDMEDCIDRLDNTRFRGDRITIEKETRSYDFRRGGLDDGGGRGSDRYGDRRDPSRSRSRSRGRDRYRDRDDDRGRDRDRDDRGRGRRDDDRDRRDDDRDRDRDRDRRDDDRDKDRDRSDGDDDRRRDDDRDRDRRRDDDDRGRDRRRDDDDRDDERDRRRDD